MKLANTSRAMAYTVIALPLVILCAGTTTPAPLASVSTRICAAAAASTVSVCVAKVKLGAVLVSVGVPATVSR